MPATIPLFPDRLTWDAQGADLIADAVDPVSCRIALIGCHWNVTHRGPAIGAAVEDCGFASTPDAAKTIANDHRRRLG
jgi:hypothetical protein